MVGGFSQDASRGAFMTVMEYMAYGVYHLREISISIEKNRQSIHYAE